MELRDDKDGWQLVLQDGFVQLIQIDFRLGLFLSDNSHKAQLYIASPCRLTGQEANALLNPEESSSLASFTAIQCQSHRHFYPAHGALEGPVW